MDFPKLSTQVSRGFTYSYVHIPPPSPSKPYVLILHGFPSVPADFHNQITYLSNAGYGILVPELLGYGDTSRPVESDPYRLKLMANDVVEILDQHSIPNVLAVGHDWGVTLLTRLEFYHPTRISKMALLAIAGGPFGAPFDIDAINKLMKERVGYEGFGYMVFFTQNHDASGLLNSRQESFRSIMFTAEPSKGKEYFGSIGGLQKWLQEDRREPALKAFTEDLRKVHGEAFSNVKGGYTASLNWYKNHVSQTNTPDEKDELEKRGLTAYQTEKPVLAILAAHDPIALPMIHKQMMEAYAPRAKVLVAESGHWVQLEAAEFVSQEISEFFAA